MAYISKISLDGTTYDLRDEKVLAPNLSYSDTSEVVHPIVGAVNSTAPEGKITYPRISFGTTTGIINSTTKYSPRVFIYCSTANNGNVNTTDIQFPVTATNSTVIFPTGVNTTILGNHNTNIVLSLDTSNYSQVVFNESDGKLYSYRSSGGGGGGASVLNDLSDVAISNASTGQVLIYNGSNQQWKNVNHQHLSYTYASSITTANLEFNNGYTREYKIIGLDDAASSGAYAISFSHTYGGQGVSYIPGGENYMLLVNTDITKKNISFTVPSGMTFVHPTFPIEVIAGSAVEVSVIQASGSNFNYCILTYSDNLSVN